MSRFRRAGDDRPDRRPDSFGWSAARAALLVLLGLLLATSFAGSAVAAPDVPESPILIGPGPAVPPPPPGLPRSKGKENRGKTAGKKAQGNKRTKAKQGNKRGNKDARDTLDLQASCAPFDHTQTYSSWGPAVAYGAPVTVVYEAARCSTPDGSSLDVSAEGTARIYEGVSADGTLLDTRPFLVTGTWRKPQNAEAWPPAWWSCSVPYASYTWQIPGMYIFRVSARDGLWSLDVSSTGVGSQDVSWTHDGCA